MAVDSRRILGTPGLIWVSTAALLAVGCISGAVLRDDDPLLAVSSVAAAMAALGTIMLLCRTAIRLDAQRSATEEARQRLQEAIEALPAGVALYDREERLVAFNRDAESMTKGVIGAANIGKTFPELVEKFAELGRAMGTRISVPPEERIADFRSQASGKEWLALDGRWVERYEQATPSGGTVTLGIDITERRRHEAELHRARDLLQSTIDALPAGVVVYDKDERLVMFNKVASEQLPVLRSPDAIGRTHSELAARTVQDLEARGAKVAPLDVLIDRFRRRESSVLAMPDGRWTAWSEVAGPEGGTIGLRVDVTELKRLELAARRASEDYRRLVNSLSDTVFRTHTRSGLIDFMSAASVQLLGWKPDELAGRSYLDFVVAEDHERIREALRQAARDSGAMRLMQYRMIHRSGELRHVEVRFNRLVDEDGRDTIAGVIRDVSDRVALEAKRRETEEALGHLERFATVGEMAGAVVHEIAQPLGVIDLARTSVADDAADDSIPLDRAYIVEKMTRIGQQVERASRIVSDLRGFMHGRVSDQVAAIDVTEAVRSVIELTHHAMMMARVQVKADLAPALPRVTARTGTLDQVLVNLLNNARDAGAKSIEVEGSAIERGGKQAVRLAVCDNGPGIPGDVLPKLFAQFVTTKPKGKGTGLGLRICRRIIDEMGGTISAGNRPEGGARFEIVLPAAGG